MSAAAGKFGPIDYPADFVSRVELVYVDDSFILSLLQRKSYTLGAYLEDRSITKPDPARIKLYQDWRQIVDSRPLSM